MGLQSKPALPNRPGNMRMAIYSLHHQPIGKSTQARPHTSAAHVRYITRPSAASRIEARRMPGTPGKAAAYMREVEDADRKNARVSDKLMLALPRELDEEQRVQLVRGFAEDVTQGRAPWLAAFHDQGKDTLNPHVHLVIRDRDAVTGRRVAGLSEKGSTERLRALWENHTNRALERAGRSERIDRRTLEAQGITRVPTVHEGPKAQQMDRRGARPQSRMRRYRNRPGSRMPWRDVDYGRIDGGRSRPDYNRDVQQETPAQYWEAIDASNQAAELEQLRLIHFRHRPDLLNVPLVGRAVEPLQRVNDTGVFSDGRLFQTQPDGQNGNMPIQHVPPSNRLPLQTPTQGRTTVFHHSLMYGDVPGKDKGNMTTRDDDDSPEARWKANDQKKRNLNGVFEHLLDNSYDDKEQAYKNMREHGAKYGNDDLYHSLRLEPGTFGAPPKDPARAADAKGYQDKLAPAFRAYGDAEDEAGRLKYTHGDRPTELDEPGQNYQPLSKLASFWDRSEPSSSPTRRADGIPQGAPATPRQPSPYPLESPFRPEGRPQTSPAASAPHEPDRPLDERAQPPRHALSRQSPGPAASPAGNNAPPKAGLKGPEGERHPLSRQSPALTKPQLTPAGATPPIAPQQALSQNPLQTPVQQQPIKQPRKGLDEGR